MISLRACALPLALCLAAGVAAAADDNAVTLTRSPGEVRVEIGGQLFTVYHYTGASRPYLYPILAADGTPLTRHFPTENVPGEDHDHPWHRSLWFAHSDVNGVDFWNEGTGDKGHAPAAKGSVLNDEILEAAGGPVGILRVSDRWTAPDGRLVCTDDRTLRFHASSAGRFIDYDVTVHALPGTPLHFGDNKDGTMAMRLAQWMTMPHKSKEPAGHGHIEDANGDKDGAAWGKRADWCDYYAPHDGQTYGVAIFDDAGNLRHPTYWMARDYGLFGANPFGVHDFEKLKDNEHAGDYTVPAGGSLAFRYRFFFHFGDTAQADVAQQYRLYEAH